MQFAPQAGVLASASWDKTVRVWSLLEKECSREVLHHGSEVTSVAFRPTQQLELVASTLAGDLCFWNAEDG